MEAPDVLEAHGDRGASGHDEYTDRRQLDHKFNHLHHGIGQHIEYLEQCLFVLGINQRDAQGDAKNDDGRHLIAAQGLEDILGNKDLHERDLFRRLHETGAEKGGRLQRGERKRQQDQNGTNNRPHKQ